MQSNTVSGEKSRSNGENCLNLNIIDNNQIDQSALENLLNAINATNFKECLCNINYMDDSLVEGNECPCFYKDQTII